MSRRKFEGVGPTGEIYRNARAYIKAWDDYKQPIEDFLGVQVYAYDPDLLIRDPSRDYTSADIPRWLMHKLYNAIANASERA
jgi:hypothetical protein